MTALLLKWTELFSDLKSFSSFVKQWNFLRMRIVLLWIKVLLYSMHH